jgi:hypothetical protein
LITVIAIALAAPAWTASLYAQVTLPPPATNVAGELKGIERRLTTALVFGDTQTLTEILDDSFIDTDEQGKQLDKAGVIAAVKSGDRKMLSIQLTGLKIHAYTYSAVMAGHYVQKGTVNGKDVTAEASFTDFFVMINGNWKLVASHRSAPTAPAAPTIAAPAPPAKPPATAPSAGSSN